MLEVLIDKAQDETYLVVVKAKCSENQLLHLEKHEKNVRNQAYSLKFSIH